VRIWLNLAAVALRVHAPLNALGWCDLVLDGEPTHIKAVRELPSQPTTAPATAHPPPAAAAAPPCDLHHTHVRTPSNTSLISTCASVRRVCLVAVVGSSTGVRVRT
jgi:hypothetical protein